MSLLFRHRPLPVIASLVAVAFLLACPQRSLGHGTSTSSAVAGGAAAPSTGVATTRPARGTATTGGVTGGFTISSTTTTSGVGTRAPTTTSRLGTTSPTKTGSGADGNGESEITVSRPVRPARTMRHRASGGLSGGAIAAAVLGALIVLLCLAWGLLRFGAFEPRWMLSLRHSVAEAAFRTSATWAEFLDWVRLGH
jgi:hypothetical protein